MKNIRFFYLNFFHFLVVKFSVHLNRHVFVMEAPNNIRAVVKHQIQDQELTGSTPVGAKCCV